MVGVAAEAFPAGAVGEMAAGFRAVAGIAEEAAQAAAGSSEARNSKLAMNTKHFLNAVDHDKIVAAIAAAEERTSGEIRVFISRQNPENALDVANKWFKKLKMDRTPDRNGILILIAPRVHKFAVVGDTGIHAKCGDSFWLKVVEMMRSQFKSEKYTDALVAAIGRLGELLAEHFPAPSGGRTNRISNSVVEG
jgi:uncharacterized membrane protein